jgi:Glycosyltransferase
MKISVDAGAISTNSKKRSGNYTFAENLIFALKKYDKKNQYHFYSFKKSLIKFGWLKIQISIFELFKKSEVFLALNQAIPLYIKSKIICFSHGLAYYFFPHLYPQDQVKKLKDQLKEMIKRSEKIVVSSEKVKNELIRIKKEIKDKIIVLPFGIPFDVLNFKENLPKEKYFLVVAANQKIKNLTFIFEIFQELSKTEKFKDFKLYLVTDEEKNFDEKLKDKVKIFIDCSRKKLLKLYQKAYCLWTSSFYESFNFPVVEALALKTPVVGLESAIVPELKEFVNVAKNKKEFIKLTEKLAIKPNLKSISQLKKRFSWKKYVRNLLKLY